MADTTSSGVLSSGASDMRHVTLKDDHENYFVLKRSKKESASGTTKEDENENINQQFGNDRLSPKARRGSKITS